MTCCGKGKKAARIVRAHTLVAVEKHTGIEILKYERTDERIGICRDCDDSTWMTRGEHRLWLLSHGVDVAKNFEDRSGLPLLPKYPLDKKRRTLYCRICKCPIPEKAWDKKNKCDKKKWEILNDGI